MRGCVTTGGEAWFPIRIFAGRWITLDGVVDTGFEDFLSLPVDTCHRLGILPVARRTYILADGSPVRSEVGRAMVDFLEGPQQVPVVFADSDEALIGVRLLRRGRLLIRYRRRVAQLGLDR